MDIAPAAEFDASITLTAPTGAGTYQGQWILTDPAGNTFGDLVFYQVIVPGTPDIQNFRATKYWIQPGEEVTLSWDLSKAYDGAFLQATTIDGAKGEEEGVVAPGTKVVAPAVTTTYDLFARNDQGESMRRLTVMVAASPTPSPTVLPIIAYFRADKDEIDAGEEVVLSWDLSGAESAFLVSDGDEAGITAPGEKSVAPDSTTVYRLVARNGAGESTSEVTVVVKEEEEADPTPELTPTNTPESEESEPEATPTEEPAGEEATATPESAAEEATPTAEPAEEEATATPEPAEAEPTPTADPEEAEPTEEPAEESPAATAREDETAIRTNPDGEAESVTTVGAGQNMELVGRSEDGTWVQVRMEDGSEGWVETGAVDANVEVATLPVTTTP